MLCHATNVSPLSSNIAVSLPSLFADCSFKILILINSIIYTNDKQRKEEKCATVYTIREAMSSQTHTHTQSELRKNEIQNYANGIILPYPRVAMSVFRNVKIAKTKWRGVGAVAKAYANYVPEYRQTINYNL